MGVVCSVFTVGVVELDNATIMSNGAIAAEKFCAVESHGRLAHITPFTWLFIRPPWAFNGACCKECVFQKMAAYSKQASEVQTGRVCVNFITIVIIYNFMSLCNL